MKHLHHRVFGYTSIENGALTNPVEIEITDCSTEEAAIERAKKLIERPQYLLKSVRECTVCGDQAELLATQRYMASVISKDTESKD